MKDGQTFGQWLKWDFEGNGDLNINDKNGSIIYIENSHGTWAKWERNSKSEITYHENSNGQIIDNRIPEIIERNGHKYQLIP
jgi:hypothetical protein